MLRRDGAMDAADFLSGDGPDAGALFCREYSLLREIFEEEEFKLEVDALGSTNDDGAIGAEVRRVAVGEGIALDRFTTAGTVIEEGIVFDARGCSPFLRGGIRVVAPLTSLERDALEYARGLPILLAVV